MANLHTFQAFGRMYYFYILKSKIDSKLYYGFTSDLRKRMQQHNEGESRSTKARRPLELMYYEAYRSKLDAYDREQQIKKNGKAKGQLLRRIKASIEA